MSTVVEIEAAIEKLPVAEYRKLLAWIEERQAMIGASEGLFSASPRLCGEFESA